MSFEWLSIIILIWIAVVDYRHFIIPNAAILLLLILKAMEIYPHFQLSHMIAPVVLLGILLALNAIIKSSTKKDAIGMGDIKLLAVLSIALSPFDLSFLIWLASLSALIALKWLKWHEHKAPFGMYISLAYLVVISGYHRTLIQVSLG